ncbi:hypothetical protein [Marinomonas sp. FW-1]|uniref:hypothetical protein n=1 Tax=Marinomonas sp. FW-1 TaxID=2071621 RepID=UPI0010C143F4|nr:hypothetical protein [Marinomonas sp. FW-1]
MKSGWSFCIVTAKGNELLLSKAIDKIREALKEEAYEIVIVGNPDLNFDDVEKIKVIPFKEDFFQLSFSKNSIVRAIKTRSIKPFFYRHGAICHKKNLAAKHAKYDKLCMMHDYVGLETGWYEGFRDFGENWDVAMNIILNKDGSRHRDWMAWDHPTITDNSNGEGACLIPYNKYTKYMYISGTYFCVKREFFINNPLNEKLFWGDAEDVEWSLRVREKTKFKMNINSSVKYLKLKDVNGAPNCESWVRNRVKMESILK